MAKIKVKVKEKVEEQPKPKGDGTYFAFSNGRVARTYPDGFGWVSGMTSMDTTGYSKGKKNFTLTEDFKSTGKKSKNVSREEVPSKIEELKKGATRFQNWTKNKTK